MSETNSSQILPLTKLICTFPNCHKSFSKPSKLQRHFLSHSENKSFICQACNASFKRKDHLKRHILSHDPNGKKFHCPHPDCASIGFVDNYHLKRHIACVHDSPIKCKICNICFEKKYLLSKHQHLQHGILPEFKCENCQKYHYNEAYYREHIRNCKQIQNHDKKCDNLNEEKTKQNLSGQKRESPEKDLENETKSPKKEKMFYKCPYENCGSCLTTQYNLKIHIQKHHERIISEKCTVEGCQACFLHRKSLKEHMKKVHSIA